MIVYCILTGCTTLCKYVVNKNTINKLNHRGDERTRREEESRESEEGGTWRECTTGGKSNGR